MKESGKCAATARHFTHSKVMAWVAFDRAIKSAETVRAGRAARTNGASCGRGFTRRFARKGFDPSCGSFVQSYGSKQLDASLLLMPIVGFLPVYDPRVKGP